MPYPLYFLHVVQYALGQCVSFCCFSFKCVFMLFGCVCSCIVVSVFVRDVCISIVRLWEKGCRRPTVIRLNGRKDFASFSQSLCSHFCSCRHAFSSFVISFPILSKLCHNKDVKTRQEAGWPLLPKVGVVPTIHQSTISEQSPIHNQRESIRFHHEGHSDCHHCVRQHVQPILGPCQPSSSASAPPGRSCAERE